MENPYENISIRPFVLGDIPRLYDAIIESKESLGAWLPWCHPDYSIADTQNWVRAQTGAFARGDEYAFAVLDAQDRLVGGCAINHVIRTDRCANIGYWTRLSCTGKGVATKAATHAVNWAFANTNLHRLEILAAVENTASRRVAEKAGATFAGIMSGRLCLQEKMHDAAMYVFLRTGGAIGSAALNRANDVKSAGGEKHPGPPPSSSSALSDQAFQRGQVFRPRAGDDFGGEGWGWRFLIPFDRN